MLSNLFSCVLYICNESMCEGVGYSLISSSYSDNCIFNIYVLCFYYHLSILVTCLTEWLWGSTLLCIKHGCVAFTGSHLDSLDSLRSVWFYYCNVTYDDVNTIPCFGGSELCDHHCTWNTGKVLQGAVMAERSKLHCSFLNLFYTLCYDIINWQPEEGTFRLIRSFRIVNTVNTCATFNLWLSNCLYKYLLWLCFSRLMTSVSQSTLFK